MQGTTTELLLVLVLITLSAFFSATETAYSSLNRARLKSLADRGQKRAADTLALADRYDELLSTILVGNQGGAGALCHGGVSAHPGVCDGAQAG